jgi:ABC-type branched-subunit amino acid transport system ATPase component
VDVGRGPRAGDVEGNIRAGAEQGVSKASWVGDLLWPGRHALGATAVAAIRGFDLASDLDARPEELSYGKRRLVGIALAVASGPSVVLFDGPAAGLDETESRELAGLIRRLAHERKMGILLVEHDVPLVMSTCDRIVCIDFGRADERGVAVLLVEQHVRQALSVADRVYVMERGRVSLSGAVADVRAKIEDIEVAYLSAQAAVLAVRPTRVV